MARYRLVQTEFWSDPKVLEEMTVEDRYFYLYLLTNPATTMIGIYTISKKVMAFELGYSMESINAIMDRFINHHKLIKYNSETRELAIKNWGKHNLFQKGKPMIDCVKKELSMVRDISLIEYVAANVVDEKYKEIYFSFIGTEENEEQPDEDVKKSNFKPQVDEGNTSQDTNRITARITTGGQEKEIEIEKEEEKEIEIIKDIHVDSCKSTCAKDSKNKQSKVKNQNTPYKDIVDTYNSICISLPKVTKITDKRKKDMRAIWKFVNGDMVKIKDLFTKAESSDFLSGRSAQWNGCGFDWLINKNNAVKVLEGNYVNRQQNQEKNSQYYQKPSKFVNFKQREWNFDELERMEREYLQKQLQEPKQEPKRNESLCRV